MPAYRATLLHMSTRLPLFPLGTVLFPGLVLPLHVFEERYRALVRDLARPDDEAEEFGVVAIQQGWEVTGVAGASVTLHHVGCTAEIRQKTEHPDGRYDLVTVGRRRFRIESIDADSAPYLIAEIEWLPEPDGGEETEKLVPSLLELFQRYLSLIRTDGVSTGEQMPDDPGVLSYLIAATTVLTVEDRQHLLAAPDTYERLRAERRLLSREMALLRHVRALPVPLRDTAIPPSPN